MLTSKRCKEKWFRVFLSAVFGDRQRTNVKKTSVRYNGNFFNTKFRENGENRQLFFRKFPGMSTSKCCREVSFGCFWVRFSRIDGGTCQEARCAIKWKSYAWVPQIASHFLNCLQNYALRAYWKNFSGRNSRWLKMLTQNLNYSDKHFSLFFPAFLISGSLAARLSWALCPVLPMGLIRHCW